MMLYQSNGKSKQLINLIDVPLPFLVYAILVYMCPFEFLAFEHVAFQFVPF